MNYPRPPDEYLPWFVQRANTRGWVLRDQHSIGQRIEHWKEGKGRGRYWRLTPEERRTLLGWRYGKHLVHWLSVQRLVEWSGLTVQYWLGDCPPPLPPAPKKSEKPILRAKKTAPVASPAPAAYNFFAGCIP